LNLHELARAWFNTEWMPLESPVGQPHQKKGFYEFFFDLRQRCLNMVRIAKLRTAGTMLNLILTLIAFTRSIGWP
jgi:hypothetical protein